MKHCPILLTALLLSACATTQTARIQRLPESASPAPLTAEEKAKLTELNARILREQDQKVADERAAVERARELQNRHRDYYYGPYPYFYYGGPHWRYGYGGWYW